MFYNGHHIDKSMVNAPPGCKGQTSCLECTRSKCRYDKDLKEPKDLRMLTCPVCGKEFEKIHNNQKYCSSECAKHRRKEYAKTYYRKNFEKYQKRSKAYYLAHKDELLEYNRKYQKEHRRGQDDQTV